MLVRAFLGREPRGGLRGRGRAARGSRRLASGGLRGRAFRAFSTHDGRLRPSLRRRWLSAGRGCAGEACFPPLWLFFSYGLRLRAQFFFKKANPTKQHVPLSCLPGEVHVDIFYFRRTFFSVVFFFSVSYCFLMCIFFHPTSDFRQRCRK